MKRNRDHSKCSVFHLAECCFSFHYNQHAIKLRFHQVLFKLIIPHMLLTFYMCFFKTLMSLLNSWQISSHSNSVSDFWILLSILIHWWEVIDSLLLWKSSLFNLRSEHLTHVECIHLADWILHKISSTNDCTLFCQCNFSGRGNSVQ